jgi:hypothetical protein
MTATKTLTGEQIQVRGHEMGETGRHYPSQMFACVGGRAYFIGHGGASGRQNKQASQYASRGGPIDGVTVLGPLAVEVGPCSDLTHVARLTLSRGDLRLGYADTTDPEMVRMVNA